MRGRTNAGTGTKIDPELLGNKCILRYAEASDVVRRLSVSVEEGKLYTIGIAGNNTSGYNLLTGFVKSGVSYDSVIPFQKSVKDANNWWMAIETILAKGTGTLVFGLDGVSNAGGCGLFVI